MYGTAVNALTSEEETLLIGAGKDPADFAAVMVPAANVQVAPVNAAGQAGYIFQVFAVVPDTLLDMPVSAVLTPGGPAANRRVQEALPIAPLVRMVVHRSALAAPAREALEGGAAPELPPLPALRRFDDSEPT